ncbi:pentatricopeptide repeat-containing protein At3g58590-like [Wolffia australiana]
MSSRGASLPSNGVLLLLPRRLFSPSSMAGPPSTSSLNSLISYLGKLGRIAHARALFDEMPRRTSVSYNAMIAAHARAGHLDESFLLVSQMMLAGLRPAEPAFAAILAAPAAGLRHARLAHPLLLKTGLLGGGGGFASTAMIGALGRGGDVAAAAAIFHEMGGGVAAWNAMIGELSRAGQRYEALRLFAELRRSAVGISEVSLAVVLAVSSPSVEEIHGLAVKLGLDYWVLVGNSLLSCYCEVGGDGGRTAEKVLWGMPERDVASWNAIVSGLRKLGEPVRALRFVSLMSSVDGILPNGRTMASALRATVDGAALLAGEAIHGKVVILGLEGDEFVASSLVNFYGRLGKTKLACSLFEAMPLRGAPAWNALVGGASRHGEARWIAFVREMLRSGSTTAPNEFSFSAALRASSMPDLLQLHCLALKLGFDCHAHVASAAVSAYSSCDPSFDPSPFLPPPSKVVPNAVANAVGGIWNRQGHYSRTIELMSSVEEPDLVSCNILLAAGARAGDHAGSMRQFRQMVATFGPPDKFAAVSYLNLCKNQADLRLGALCHGQMVKTGLLSYDVFALNALLAMYGHGGSLESCRKAFEEMPARNLVSWTAMVAALGVHGRAGEAVAMIRQMEEEEGLVLDRVAFLAGILACRHGGLVKEGVELLRRMEEEEGAPPPGEEHYAGVVELLCKAGMVEEAERIIGSMPFPPGPAIWRVFLRGCGG